MKTAAAYIRVSDERQDEFSPDSQLKLIREYCKKNDIVLPDELIFYDDGISAKSTKKRTQFNNMIALAKQKDKPFQMIIVWKFSRFARNQEESIVYKSLLRRNGVEVISVSEPLSDNPFGGLIERIIEWMDEYYLIRLSDEVRRGMTERATRGLPNVAPPFGYKMVNGAYEVNEDEARIVRMIFDMFISGNGTRNISAYLTSLDVKNHYGNHIDNRGVDYILNNPCYIGYLRWNPHGRSSSDRNFNNPDDILVKSTHKPIISEDIYNKAQELVEARKKSNQKYVRENFQIHNYMLRGLVKCHTCGSTMVYIKAHNSLQCHQYAKGVCPVSHSINLDVLNQKVIDALKEAVTTLSFNVALPGTTATPNPPIDFDAMIHSEQLKLERAKQAYQEGVDSLNEYRATKEKIEKKIKHYKEQKIKIGATAAGIDFEKFARAVADVIEIAENPNVSPELKNNALKSVVQKIVFYKPDKHIELFFYM